MKTAAQVVSKNIVVVQTAMDVAGMIPGIGEAFDVASGMISLARGDYAEAALSMASAIPIVGNMAGAAKIANRVDDVVGVAKGANGRRQVVIGEKMIGYARSPKTWEQRLSKARNGQEPGMDTPGASRRGRSVRYRSRL